MENLPSALPLDTIFWAPPLDHGHQTTWWWKCFFFDDWLPWLDDMLDRGGLMALLQYVWWRMRWRWWCVVSHSACDRLLGSHLLLKRLAEPKEFPALDEEMCWFSPSVLVDVGVPGAPSVEHFFCRKWWLVTTPKPLCFWPRIAASASTTASVVSVPLPWSIVIVVVVVVHVACCYHVCRIRISITTLASLLPHSS
jgi:hypothetical protein